MTAAGTAIFDLDDTLVPFSRARARHLEALVTGLADLLGAPEAEVVAGFHSLFRAHGRFLPARHLDLHPLVRGRPVDAQAFDALAGRAEAAYAAALVPEPAVLGLLDRLAAAGWRLALYTAGPPAATAEKLALTGLAPRFEAVFTADPGPLDPPGPDRVAGVPLHRLGPAPKSGPEGLRRVLETLGVPAERAVMIGDHPTGDVLMAGRAGVRSVLATWHTGTLDPRTVATVTRLFPAELRPLRQTTLPMTESFAVPAAVADRPQAALAALLAQNNLQRAAAARRSRLAP